MKINGLLPIGSVVLLKNSTKRVMIIGVCQSVKREDGEQIYDYAGCFFPEGFISPTKNFVFNGEQIDKLYFMGFQDAEQLAFKEKADALMEELRAKKAE